jgi:hypothetical protein
MPQTLQQCYLKLTGHRQGEQRNPSGSVQGYSSGGEFLLRKSRSYVNFPGHVTSPSSSLQTVCTLYGMPGQTKSRPGRSAPRVLGSSSVHHHRAPEAGTAEAGRRYPAHDPSLSLPPGDQQMEQGRAQTVFVHFVELARRTAARLRDDRQSHRPDDDGQGSRATCRLDRRKVVIGRRITAREMKRLNIQYNKFHGDWNYTIRAREKSHLMPIHIAAA